MIQGLLIMGEEGTAKEHTLSSRLTDFLLFFNFVGPDICRVLVLSAKCSYNKYCCYFEGTKGYLN